MKKIKVCEKCNGYGIVSVDHDTQVVKCWFCKPKKKKITDFTNKEKESLDKEATDLYNNIEWT